MGLTKFADIDTNKINETLWRKTTSLTSSARTWYDDSMLAGIPVANFYASSPLVAATLNYRDGIRHWLPGTHTEHLLDMMVMGGTLEAPTSFLLCDYLLYYPFIDGDSTDAQDLDNTVTLPRFTDGNGVKAFIVAQGAGAAVGTYSLSYTNQDGVSGRTATGAALTPLGTGALLTSGSAAANRVEPFIKLEGTDRGIRSIEQFTWLTAPGGIAAIVIVKPIAQFSYLEIGTAAETIFYPRFPQIHGEAFLGLLRSSALATPNARTYTGMMRTLRD